MTYQPRHRAKLNDYGNPLDFFAWSPERSVDFWRELQDLDVPGPGAKPIQTTPGPGHQPDPQVRAVSETYDEANDVVIYGVEVYDATKETS